MLLAHGASMTARDSLGRTPLHALAQHSWYAGPTGVALLLFALFLMLVFEDLGIIAPSNMLSFEQRRVTEADR